MFSNIFFLMVMLILIAFASEMTTPLLFSNQPILALSFAAVLYIFTVTLIYSQNMRLGRIAYLNKNKMSILAQVELAIFFIAYFFFLGIQRFFNIDHFILGNTFSAIFALMLYFGGLASFSYAQNQLQYGREEALFKTKMQLTFLIPFLIPFLIYVILADMSILIPWDSLRHALGIIKDSQAESFVFFLISLSFVILMIVLMPLVVVKCWGCQDLNDSNLKERLNTLCQKAKFKHAGLKTWDVIQDSMTAAIIGVWSRFRYVMFTPKLLRQMKPNAIEAILAHEIGHSKSKHLLIYPFIILGIVMLGGVMTSLISIPLMNFLEKQLSLSLEVWNVLSSLLYFIIFIVLLGILFRIIFGYFSRLFERQADLYIFQLGIPASYLIEAFDEIAIASGYIHDVPNWHHYSIQQRMDFLKKAEKNSSLINIHRRKVIISLMIYFIFLTLTTITY